MPVAVLTVLTVLVLAGGPAVSAATAPRAASTHPAPKRTAKPKPKSTSTPKPVPPLPFLRPAAHTPVGPATVGELVAQGLTGGRDYLVHPPQGAAARPGAHPLLVVLHGWQMTPEGTAADSGIDAAADAAGYLVVHGDSAEVDGSWAAGLCCGTAVADGVDDVGYLRAVVADAVAREPAGLGVDVRRVFTVGFSNGGMLAFRAACELPGTVRAAVTVDGSLVAPCPGPAHVLHLQGRYDPTVPLLGGGSDTTGVVVPDARTEAARVPGGDDTVVVFQGAHWWPTADRDRLDGTATALAWLARLH